MSWLTGWKALVQEGFAVDCVSDGRAADHLLQGKITRWRYWTSVCPVLTAEVVHRLRKRGQTLPVLFLTARSNVADRVKGLNAGADDYLPKPFELEELDAGLRALLRRSEGEPNASALGSWSMTTTVFPAARRAALAHPRELSLLKVLMHRRTRPFPGSSCSIRCLA